MEDKKMTSAQYLKLHEGWSEEKIHPRAAWDEVERKVVYYFIAEDMRTYFDLVSEEQRKICATYADKKLITGQEVDDYWDVDLNTIMNAPNPEFDYDPKEKLTFGDLKEGDKFIGFPLEGDNDGHGGFKGTHWIFEKIDTCKGKSLKSETISTYPDGMHVIKVD